MQQVINLVGWPKLVPLLQQGRTGACMGMQGFTAFKLNVQLSREFNDKLARAAGKFKNQLVGSAYETWKQYAQHNKMLQSRLATAVGALRNRGLRLAFCGWREAALIRKEHKQKVRPNSD